MRRLPIFLVIDVSESMVGQPLRQMQEGISRLIETLRRDPYALETVYLSVIAFAGIAKTLAPLVELVAFYRWLRHIARRGVESCDGRN